MDITYNEELQCYEDESNVYNTVEDILVMNQEYFEGKDVAYLRIVWNEQPPKRIYDLRGVCYWSNEISL
jgi:hypothetical protein